MSAPTPPGRPRRAGSVIIAAHDEAAVIDRCLSSLTEGFAPGELTVIVSCNGCTDDTAARAAAHDVTVIETPLASKPAALRAAEGLDPPYPRLYLDADVELSSSAARAVLGALDSGVLAARPPIRWDLGGCSPVVRAYYRARSRSHSVMGRLWGAGVFGLSEAGRRRFASWPDVVGDDLFADRHFTQDEIVVVGPEPVVVRVPRTTSALLRVTRRAQRGRIEEHPVEPGTIDGAGPAAPSGIMGEVLRSATTGPHATLDALVYAAVSIVARCWAHVGPVRTWERDETTRTLPGVSK